MKVIRQLFIGLVLAGSMTSCYDLLTEVPKDFLTPENSYTDRKGFEAALANIYLSIRNDFYANSDQWQNFDLMGVDVDLNNPRTSNDIRNISIGIPLMRIMELQRNGGSGYTDIFTVVM